MAPSDLFDGLHFWIALRVPTRSSLLAAVQDHGGSIVAREKDADLLIADHARKDVPAGSISWRFITESVRNGRREEPETHRIGPAPKTARPAAKGTAKSTRTRFTEEDDNIIRAWVSKHDTATKGNVLFQDLEVKHPHHTWHSWRDRWVKKLAGTGTGAPTSTPSLGAAATAAPLSANVAPPASEGTAKKSRRPYTKEDDDIVRDWIAKQPGGTSGIKIFQDLEAKHPQHSWQSWKERWNKKLVNTTTEVATSTASAAAAAAAAVAAAAPVSSSSTNHDRNRSLAATGEGTSEQNIPSRAFSPSPRSKDKSAPSSDKANGTVPHARAASPPQPSDTDASDRSNFLELLQQFREMNGQALVTSVSVTRRPVDLWHLWRAVTAQEVKSGLRDWELIADTLGFDSRANPVVATQLRKAFDLHLQPFELAQEEFKAYVQAMEDVEDSDDSDDSGDSDGSGNSDHSREPDRPGSEPEAGSSSPAFRSSPPLAGIKRGWREAVQSGIPSTYLEPPSPRKRRRHDQDVIPESPEVRAYTALPSASISPLQLPKSGQSEALGKRKRPLRASILGMNVGSRPARSGTEDSAAGRQNREPTPSPPPSPTPSQQLHLESEIASPDPPTIAEDSARSHAASASDLKVSSFAEELENLVGLGLHPDVVTQAYKATSLNRHLAGKVLEVLLRHERVPSDQAGIWTKQDDAMLSYIDEALLARASKDPRPDDLPRRKRMERHREKLETKHGRGSLEKRREFLKVWVVPPGFAAIGRGEGDEE